MTKKEIGQFISENFMVLVEASNERGFISERPYLKEDAEKEAEFLLHEQTDPNVIVYMFGAVLAINGSIQRGDFIRQFEK